MKKVYKVIYFMEAETDLRKVERTIKDILHHVQGMNTKLVSFEEVNHEEKNV